MFASKLRTAALGLVVASALSAAYQGAGNVTSVQIGSDQIDFVLDSGAVARVQLLDSDVIRVRVNRSGTLSDVSTGAVLPSGLAAPGAAIQDTGDAVIAGTALATVVVYKKPFRVIVLRGDYTTISADTPDGVGWDTETGLIVDQKIADPTEAFFGLGERGGPINRRGRSFVMHNVDNSGYGEFTDPLYISIPFYYGILNGKAYGIFVDNPADPFFDMDSGGKGVVSFGAHAGELNYYIFAGPEPARVAGSYGRLTGFNPLPPLWALGFHQSRYGYQSQDDVLSVASTFRSLKIPCDVLWMDIDYMNQMHLFTYDPATWPTPAALHATLGAQGFRRVNIIEPLMRIDDPLWDYSNRMGYFLTNPDGTSLVSSNWYGDVSFWDFTNSGARTWYKQALAGFLSAGTNGIWADLNEPAQNYMPQATYNSDGQAQRDSAARNTYALNELSLLNQTWSETHPNERYFGVSRSGYSGIQRYTANWSGDTLSTFDSLRVSLQMSISMGFSGQNFFGHDIGGFLGSPSAELFTRWFEFGSLIPLFRDHSTNTASRREPWVFGEPYTSMVRNTTNARYLLLPYIYSAFQLASTTGLPVVGPLPFYFPEDTNTFNQDQSFLLGPNMLVAPVTAEGAVTREVYFPKGTDWYDINTDELHPGATTATVDAPLERVPVFARAGAIIPRGPALQYTADTSASPRLSIDVYPGPDSYFTLYEDDGTSLAYQLGASKSTLLRHATGTNSSVLTMQRFGSSLYVTPSRPVLAVFHGITTAPARVQINQTMLTAANSIDDLNQRLGYVYDSARQLLTVRFEDAFALQVTVIF